MKHVSVLFFLALPAVAFAQPKLPEGVTTHRDLEYVEKGHARNKLDLYLPKSEKPLPLIIWIHGGGWSGGDKANPPTLLLTQKGFAVASINYRLSQHAAYPAQIHDCKAAVRWLRANAKKYNLDAEHFGVVGASAGGHLVALLGTSGGVKELEGEGGNAKESSRVQCVVDFFGPTDLVKLSEEVAETTGLIKNLLGGPIQNNKDKAKSANPMTYVDKDDPPFLIIHGDKDPLVLHSQSELLRDALKTAKVPVELVTIKDGKHGGAEFMSPERIKQVEDFLKKHLQVEKK